MKLAEMAGIEDASSLRAVVSALDPEAPADYREVAGLLALDWKEKGCRRAGIAGGQGAGKSTLGRLIEAACREVGLRACVVGIDDFYLTRAERRTLAEGIHPLFETRGPPGTHDLALCESVMASLFEAGAVACPQFDKGRDDRAEPTTRSGPYDLVVLEGWCVGATPESRKALATPINVLESEEDPTGDFRRYANDRLRHEYRALYAQLDSIAFLAVPSLDAVRRWRLQQEEARPESQRLDGSAIARFVQHYERVTLEMLRRLPQEVDWTFRLAEDHSVAAVERSVKG